MLHRRAELRLHKNIHNFMKLLKVIRVVSASLGELPIQDGGGSFKPQMYKRETKIGETPGSTGYVESPTVAELKIKLNAAIDPSDFKNISSDTVTIYLSSGSTHVMPNAWVIDTIELQGGEYEVTYNSATSEKL